MSIRRRRFSRVQVNIPANYSSDHLHMDGMVTDLSMDGLFFNADFLDGAGELARVHLHALPGCGALDLRGEVRWVRQSSLDGGDGGGMGIFLIGVSRDDRVVLASILSGLGQGVTDGDVC